MKVVVGLGNPGPRYDETRHNVGWWALDRMAYDWDFGPFEREGQILTVRGRVGGADVQLAKPTTYMNRSGQALDFMAAYARSGFSVASDLLIVVDDASLDVGRMRIRPSGSSGGHNGLGSVEQALGRQDYARLRIGVGRRPENVDMTDWVLSAFPPEDEETILELLPEVTRATATWTDEGIEATMNRFNR